MMIFLLLLIGVLSVAFITLIERKVLGLRQIRFGPNKLSLAGLFQPVMDGIKLLSKTYFDSKLRIISLLGPLGVMFLFLINWTFLFWLGIGVLIKATLFLLIICLGLLSYSVIITRWTVTSTFPKLGLIRSLLQSLSYEVSLVSVLLIVGSTLQLIGLKRELSYIIIIWLVSWILILLIDCNRAPFDLLEGERELISGFNTEINRLGFIFLFLGEYGMILVLSTLLIHYIKIRYFLCMLLLLISLISRRVYPRIRYDIITTFIWITVLPVVMLLLIVRIFIK